MCQIKLAVCLPVFGCKVYFVLYCIIVAVGDYVMIEPIAEGDKVKAEISHILYRPQVQFIQQQGLWSV